MNSLVLLFLIMNQATPAPIEPIRPPPLESGDTIGLVAPAGIVSREQVRLAAERLKAKGFRVAVAGAQDESRGYLAADDSSRAAALNALIQEPSVKAILCLRGGYGSPRILDRVDYDGLRRNPKIIIGYSDITALLIAVQRKTGLVTFHGPMGRELAIGLSPYTEQHYWPLLGPCKGPIEDWGGARASGMRPPTTLVEGTAEGVLIGGNLSLVTALLGTPYEIETNGAILFLEEVSEKPFRIDRMLNQLRLAKKLEGVRGVILGGFPGCEARDPDGDLEPTKIFIDYFRPLGVPVLAEYPAGHVPDQATLPLGAKVRLDATRGRLTILECPVAESRNEGGSAPADENAPR